MLPLCAVTGRCGSAASASSEISCSHSQVFDELEAIAPRSTSCASLDDMSDASDHNSPDTGRRTNLFMGQEAFAGFLFFKSNVCTIVKDSEHILGIEVY